MVLNWFQCGIVLPKKSEFPALLVVSSARLYVLRISGKQRFVLLLLNHQIIYLVKFDCYILFVYVYKQVEQRVFVYSTRLFRMTTAPRGQHTL